MGGVARAVLTPISIIDKDLARTVLQITAVAAAFIPGGQPIAAAAALTLAVLYRPKGPKPEQQERALKTSLPPRVSAYGRVRLYGAYILFVTNEDGYAVDMWAFHDGRIDGIEKYFLGDKEVTIDGSGWVQALDDGQFGDGDTVRIGANLGAETETAFAPVVSTLPGIWTSNHRGDGVVTGYMISRPVKAKNYNRVYPGGGPDASPMSLVIRAQPVFDWRDEDQDVNDRSTWKWSENNALHIAHYLLARDNKDWDTHFAPTIDYWTAFADDCDVAMATKYGGGTTTITAAIGATSITLDSVTGLTNGATITFLSSGETKVVSGIVGNVVSFSPGLSNEYDPGNDVHWIGGGTEPRYRSCVAHKHNEPHKVVLGNLLACCDGWVAPRSDGALIAYSGRYYEPDEADLIGPDEIISYSWDDGIADEDAINEIAISYISAAHDFVTVDADAWRDEDGITEAGEVKSTTLENSVPSHSQARRLAKRLMSKSMAPYRGTVTTNRRGRKIRGKRYIPLHIEEAGAVFFSGVAEITRLTNNGGGVTFSWISADPNIDAWNPATEEGEPAPVGEQVASEPLVAPTISNAQFIDDDNSGSGTAGARVRIVATGPDRDDLTWFARWRVIGAAVWNESEYSDIDPGASVTLETGFVPADSSVEVSVAYQVGDGRVSPWSDPPTPVVTSVITADTALHTVDTTAITADRT